MPKDIPSSSSILTIPRVVVAGLSGGSGKTIVSLGLVRAMASRGLHPRAYKKGPDYIDAVWLGLAANNPAVNLDPFLIPEDKLLPLFAEKARGFDMALIEGNRGLFDGKDVAGSCSTAQLARLLGAPIILVMDCTKTTRTAAAVLKGCMDFEPGTNLAGVILNRTAGERHRAILTDCIREYTGLPVLGALPKIADNPIPERHMGLISNREYEGQEEILNHLGRTMEKWCDLAAISRIAGQAPDLDIPPTPLWPEPVTGEGPVIGVVRDAALWFYYPENIEALERAGAVIREVSILDDAPWPEMHGLYLGGGFPETQAARLEQNSLVRNRVRSLARGGMPIYAECGGFMYLCRALSLPEGEFQMAGVLPLTTQLCARPQGLGYTEAVVVRDTPFFTKGTRLKGHEFHYSRFLSGDRDNLCFCLQVERGQGILESMDGVAMGNVLAGYKHIHTLGAPGWAENFVRAALAFKQGL